MPKFVLKIESKSKGNLKYVLNHPDDIPNTDQLKLYLNSHIGFDYQIASVYPVSDEEYNELLKNGLSQLK